MTAAAVLAVGALGAGVAFAAAGDQDPSFNGGTAQLIDFPGGGDAGSQVAVDGDGSIVVAGTPGISLARLSAGGQPVAAFGTGGVAQDDSIVGLDSAPTALALAPDGDIFVGVHAQGLSTRGASLTGPWSDPGNAPGDFTIARYDAAGAPQGSRRIWFYAGGAYLAGLVPQADGGVIAAGSVTSGDNDAAFVAVRLTPAGDVDTSFGATDDGISRHDTDGADAFGAAHQPTGPAGSVVVVGYSYKLGEYVLMRFLADGTIDDTFGGRFAAPYGYGGKLGMARDGSFYTTAGDGFALRHWTAAGQPDTAFGTDGVANLPAGVLNGSPSAGGVSVQADGKVVVSGTIGGGDDPAHIVAARFTATGAFDPTFGSGGLVSLPRAEGVNAAEANGATADLDGKPVIVGDASFNQSETAPPAVAVARGTQALVARLDDGVAASDTTTTTTTTTGASDTPAPAAGSVGTVTATSGGTPVSAKGTLSIPAAKSCVSRRSFKIRLRLPHGAKASSATVKVNGKRVQVIRGSRLKAAINLRGLPKGRATVSITVKLVGGKTLTGQRKYRTCTVKKAGGVPKL